MDERDKDLLLAEYSLTMFNDATHEVIDLKEDK